MAIERLSTSTEAEAEAAFVVRLQARDEKAFEELVRREGPRMLAVATRYLGHTTDAEDALQEAFLNASRGIAGFQGGSRLSTWLHRITVNCALMQLRSKARRPERATPPEDVADHTEDRAQRSAAWGLTAADVMAREDLRQGIRDALGKLPPLDRALLTLRDIQGMTLQDVSRLLDIGLTTVKEGLHRARHALRRLLDPLLRETHR